MYSLLFYLLLIELIYAFSLKKEELLNSHNDYRQLHSSPNLEWSDELEKSAHREVSNISKNLGCELPLYYRNSPGTNYMSSELSRFKENIAVDFWYEGSSSYSYETGLIDRNPNVLAFTQLIWRNSKFIGCATGLCDNIIVLVCKYYPYGNIPGEFNENVREKFYNEANESL